MRLKIAARSSLLARVQAQMVGAALQRAHHERGHPLEVEYTFRSSWGDQNLDVDLRSVPDKGAFTADFVESLLRGECDMVVHSWKDLPTESRPELIVAATLPRAAANDILLIKEESVGRSHLRILSSSPRREFAMKTLLAEALPFPLEAVELEPIRGNVPTRLKKWRESHCDGLIMAQAALDRLAGHPEWDGDHWLSEGVKWMVLPLSQSPCAPAQGALAVEIRGDRADLRDLLKPINCEVTFREAEAERSRLRAHGGGCHLALGVSVQERDWGTWTVERGNLTGQPFHHQMFVPSVPWPSDVLWTQCWPQTPANAAPRVPLAGAWSKIFENKNLFITRNEALPSDLVPQPQQLVWAAGWSTWKKLARRGVWVHGTTDGLGGNPRAPLFAQAPPEGWVRLTHAEASSARETSSGDAVNVVATYQLGEEKISVPAGFGGYFWSSPSVFLAGLEQQPEIMKAHHACGPGKTWDLLRSHVPSERIHVYPSYGVWKMSVQAPHQLS